MKKRYTVVSTNCDCASGYKAVTTPQERWLYGPRCPHCNLVLGPMQYKVIGVVIAEYAEDAYRKLIDS